MKPRYLVVFALLAFLTGCVPVDSLNPLYTAKDVAFDESLLGFWVGPDNGEEGGLEFSELAGLDNKTLGEGGARAYVLTMYDKPRDSVRGSKTVYHAHLVNLGGRRFLDAVPEQWDARSELYSLQVKTRKSGSSIEPSLLRLGSAVYMEFSQGTPGVGGSIQANLRRAHWIIKLNRNDQKLRLDWADDDDFRKSVQAGTMHLPAALLGEGANRDVVITAGTAELQKFVVEHADDGKFFTSKAEELHRKE